MRRFSIADCRLPIGRERTSFLPRGRVTAAPLVTRQSPIVNLLAFSLVEVVLALGIVSFCLIAVIGLMPVGLKSVKNANEQAGAADVLNAIAESLRTAVSTNSTNYSNSFAGTNNITYNVGDTNSVIVTWTKLTMEGAMETPPSSPKRLAASLIITPPSNSTSPGRALVSVAWPAQANWNPTTQVWANAEGSITSGIQFLPRP